MKGECIYSDIESVQILVRQQLEDKRFLLVLDDVWTEDPMEWQRLKPLLTGNKRGSKIVVTTRSEIVSRIMSSIDISPYRLESSSVDDCWILFRQMAFGARKREEETPRLVEIGKEIVSKCGGLPLAAKALGSLMASRKGEAEWMDVKNSDMWRLPEGSDAILLPALRLSYQHLTLDLKQCFAFCRLFPKGYRIGRLKLIQLWIAEGLVQTSDTDMHLEDIGNRYFNSLLWRSFFQDEENDDSGNVVSCMMHDLIHDLACYVASNDYFIIEDAKVRRSSVPLGCRHYSVICDKDLISSETFEFGCEAKKVRTLILLGDAIGVISPDVEKSLLNMISNLTRLRVLRLSGIRICTFPSAMAKLKYLRYLDLSFTEITTIPDSITSLYNLQTLNLRHCVYLKELPEALSNMSNLRHLDISDCGLTHMPREMGRLVGIQTLPLFIVGEKPGRTVAELQNLNIIRGALAIKCLCNVKDPMGAVKAKLRAKVHLLSLELCWGMNEFWSGNLLPSNSTVEEDVIVNLQPPPNLKFLRIDKYTGSRCPDWLEKIDASSLSFSCLRTLELLSLPNMEEWNVPEATDMFPCLQRLVITRSPKLVVKPSMPCSIVELEIRGGNEELFAVGGSLQGLSGLRKLEMTHIQLSAASSQWEGLQYLTNLEELTIGWCSELIHFPCCIMQRRFPNLRTLKLEGNLELASLGEGGEDPPLFFSALHHLSITDCGLLALPEWLGGVSSLQSLTLRFCHTLAMLPDGLQRLTGLYHLTVDNCRLLRRRCERDTGEDWHRIAHIPNIKVLNVLYL